MSKEGEKGDVHYGDNDTGDDDWRQGGRRK